MNPRSSKFYPKSLTLLISILEMVKEGIIAADIARALNLEKSHVSYYIGKAKNSHYVREVVRDTFTGLELTQAGKYFLDQYNKGSLSLPICRAENIQFKANILQMPTIPVDWKKIEMRNWTQYTSQIDSVRVKLNIGKHPSLVFLPSAVAGEDPFSIFIIMVFECVRVILKLNDIMALRVGSLQLGSRGEWLVYDPVARSFCKNNGHGQVTYDGIGKVNASLPRRIGEFEFYDLRALVDYLAMPKRLQNIEEMLEKVLSRELGRA